MQRSPILGLRALNHVSIVCQNLTKSVDFYTQVLGFSEIKRPSSFDFEGAWLWQYGIGIHLIEGAPVPRSSTINPLADHLSFQADNLSVVKQALSLLNIHFLESKVHEAGVVVEQLFFHDPDNNMIEICNCDSLPICLKGEMISPTAALQKARPTVSEESLTSDDVRASFESVGTQCNFTSMRC